MPNPTVPEISHLTWDSVSIPQNAIPITIKGHPYVVEIDEFGTLDEVGAARIIDIGDETNPQVISNMRLGGPPARELRTISGDPQANFPLQGYAGHYCNVPTRVDPEIVACSMILSGLRVFDIRDPYNPREVAYYNAPIKDRVTPAPFEASNWAMSSPAFVPSRKEIWYSDGFQGFFAVRLTNGAWPSAGGRRRTSRQARRPSLRCFRASSTLAAGPKKTRRHGGRRRGRGRQQGREVPDEARSGQGLRQARPRRPQGRTGQGPPPRRQGQRSPHRRPRSRPPRLRQGAQGRGGRRPQGPRPQLREARLEARGGGSGRLRTRGSAAGTRPSCAWSLVCTSS